MTKLRLVVIGLTALAAAQTALLAKPVLFSPKAPAPPRTIVVGDSLPSLQGKTAEGLPATFDPRRERKGMTLLLAFNSHCKWCLRYAPEWQAWLRQPREMTVLALTALTDTAGFQYAEEHYGNVRVLAVPDTGFSGSLLNRTPWLFLVDSTGRIVFERHGSAITDIDSIVGETPRSIGNLSTDAVVRAGTGES